MEKTYSSRFNHEIFTLYPGEYAVASNQILHTIVGTCISVILYSDYYKTGGMNHFMLPSSHGKTDVLNNEAGRYGETAMELLINELMKKGIYKFRLKAKIFGGGRMFSSLNLLKNDRHVGDQNIEFISRYLEQEGIEITASDLGETGGRSIFFFPWDGRVLLKRITTSANIIKDIKKQEDQYINDINKEQNKKPNIFFFE